ncbi:MAG: DUF4136 domain-containing protein [Planctomycetota bacterium]|jgi:hypothetical protein
MGFAARIDAAAWEPIMSVRRIQLVATAVVALAALILASGCSGVLTSHDYDTTYDFTTLHTFDWADVTAGPDVSPLGVQRATDAVESTLVARGYAHAGAGEDPDFVLVLHAGKETKRENFNRRYEYDGYIRSAPESRHRHVYEYVEGRLQLDIVDPATHQLVWRGTAEAVVEPDLSPEKRHQRITEAVEKLLAKFPPVVAGA